MCCVSPRQTVDECFSVVYFLPVDLLRPEYPPINKYKNVLTVGKNTVRVCFIRQRVIMAGAHIIRMYAKFQGISSKKSLGIGCFIRYSGGDFEPARTWKPKTEACA